jgi:SAM-dependent methyltransferase
MKQNKYDDREFFEQYSRMPRSTVGLEAAGEWPELKSMLPDLKDKRVLDLGCGYGWHCRYARQQGAQSVVGIDLSESMLERARSMTDDAHITYRRLAIEDMDFIPGQFDVVISSLALHYVEKLEPVFQNIRDGLTPGGVFVYSVEHPIFTSVPAQDWHYGPDGEKLHWPVDNYHQEGVRQAAFLGHTVVKYHRTLASHVNTLLAAGFAVTRLSELKLVPDVISANPAFRDELRRPMFLLVAAVRL